MTNLGAMLRMYRISRKASVRSFADEIGVNFSTLHRAERNSATMGSATFVKVLTWMLLPPSHQRHRR